MSNGNHQSLNTNDINAGSTNKTIKVSSQDCPLACPMPNETLWNKHPKVYLPIEETGEATCPYCSTHYILADFRIND